MKSQEKYISKREVANLLGKSTRQVDRYAKEEKWDFCYQKGQTLRKEKFYCLVHVESKLQEFKKIQETNNVEKKLTSKVSSSPDLILLEMEEWKENIQKEIEKIQEFQKQILPSLWGKMEKKMDLAIQKTETKESVLPSVIEKKIALEMNLWTEKIQKIIEEKLYQNQWDERFKKIEKKQFHLASMIKSQEQKFLDTSEDLQKITLSSSRNSLVKQVKIQLNSQEISKAKKRFSPKSVFSQKFPTIPVEKMVEKVSHFYYKPQYSEDVLISFTLWILRLIWGTLMRVALEINQTFVMMWIWFLGYRRSLPNTFNAGHPYKGSQILDLFKFGVWILPPMFLIHQQEHKWAFIYFVVYCCVHFVWKAFFSYFGIEVSLFPSAWSEIRMKEYTFQNPFADVMRLVLFFGPSFMFLYYENFLLSLAYCTGYIGIHFVFASLGKFLGKNLSLFPTPIKEKKYF